MSKMFEAEAIVEKAQSGIALTDADVAALARENNVDALMLAAERARDAHYGDLVTYSRKVFIPLTHLCRDVCHYCTFATTPRALPAPYLSIEQAVEIARKGAEAGCVEALFTLGDKPESRYRVAREFLAEHGYSSTLEYLGATAKAVFEQTGLLPHLNPGVMNAEEIAELRKDSVSMGIMLESSSERLCERGGPHFGSPDKHPAVRLQTIEQAGELKVPFTTGILIGIGETREERIESILAIRDQHLRHGHIQEVIVQNFRAKNDTKMANAQEPELREHLWTIAISRLLLPIEVAVQAPPNLRSGELEHLVAAGINDWGGVSPVTPDHVNPEAPWPHLDELDKQTRDAGKELVARLAVYPSYLRDTQTWLDKRMRGPLLAHADASGFARSCAWAPGEAAQPPIIIVSKEGSGRAEAEHIVAALQTDSAPDEQAVAKLFEARGDKFIEICTAADTLRHDTVGDTVSFAVNRNINYTNVCYFKCKFCAFSKGRLSENLRGKPYDLALDEIARRTDEAWRRGATEVCMQGGIHPEYTGATYLEILRTVKQAAPGIHVHAFSPLEVWQGADTTGVSVARYLEQLREAGLGSLPGTAAEILDDEVRNVICPDKLKTDQWLQVVRTAHEVGFKTTSTIMFGHVDTPLNWARHLLRLRALAKNTGGITEFVPLPFVASEAPMFLRGLSRRGPTIRETVLMHAVARLVLHPYVPNIQTSWVKLGERGVEYCLRAGANDLGGTLMNESISRAAGASHGQEWPPQKMRSVIESLGRNARQRTTLYDDVDDERQAVGLEANELTPLVLTPARKYERRERRPLTRPGLEPELLP